MIINMNGAKAPETPSSVLQEKTVTPETLPVVIGPDAGYDGLTQVTVNPDSQLKAENIRSGKTIFGVQGTFTGGATTGMSAELLNSFNNFLSINPNIQYTWIKKGSLTMETVEDVYEYNNTYRGVSVTGKVDTQIYRTTMKSNDNSPTYPKKFVYTLDDVSNLVGSGVQFETSFGKTTGSFIMQVRPGEGLYDTVYASNNAYTLTGTCSLADRVGANINRCVMTITSIDQSYAINETWYSKYERDTGGPYNYGLYIDWVLVEATQ